MYMMCICMCCVVLYGVYGIHYVIYIYACVVCVWCGVYMVCKCRVMCVEYIRHV